MMVLIVLKIGIVMGRLRFKGIVFDDWSLSDQVGKLTVVLFFHLELNIIIGA